MTRMRGLTRLGLLILAVFIALPVAPLDYDFKFCWRGSWRWRSSA